MLKGLITTSKYSKRKNNFFSCLSFCNTRRLTNVRHTLRLSAQASEIMPRKFIIFRKLIFIGYFVNYFIVVAIFFLLTPFIFYRIDNLMRSVNDPVTIDETNMTSHDFSEVHLFRRAGLNMALRQERTVLKMARLFGDRTGLLHSRANQTIYLEASNTEHSVSKPAVNLRVDNNAEMVFGASLYVIGDGAKGTGQLPGESSFTLDGRMIDVTHLFITKRLKARFHTHAHSADLHNGTLDVAAPGTFVLATFEIQDGSQVYFPDYRGIQCEVGLLHMKYGSIIIADTYRVSITSLLLETGSRITASGTDRPSPYDVNSLPSSCRGSGGSYGSKGGKGEVDKNAKLFPPNCCTY